MPTPSFGSGSQLLGGTDALKAAMQSRGIDTSILDQVSSSSAVPQTPPAPTSLGSPNTSSPTTNSQQVVSGVSGGVAPQGETEIIVKALTERLKTLSKSQSPSF